MLSAEGSDVFAWDGPLVVFTPDEEAARSIAHRLGDREVPPAVADRALYRDGSRVVHLGEADIRQRREAIENCL